MHGDVVHWWRIGLHKKKIKEWICCGEDVMSHMNELIGVANASEVFPHFSLKHALYFYKDIWSFFFVAI
jgi:hypothetical protein